MSLFQPELRFSIHSKAFGMGHSQVDRCAECTSYSPPNEEKKQKMKHLMASQFSITGPSQLQVFSWLLSSRAKRLLVFEKPGRLCKKNMELFIGTENSWDAMWINWPHEGAFLLQFLLYLMALHPANFVDPAGNRALLHICAKNSGVDQRQTRDFCILISITLIFSIDIVLWNHARRRLHVHDFVIHAYMHTYIETCIQHTCIHDYIGMHR